MSQAGLLGRVLQQAKQRIAELLGADISSHPTDQLILTSGGTEANNLALRGLAVAKGRAERGADSPPPQLILSAIEHPSIAAVADQMALEGWQVEPIASRPAGGGRCRAVAVDALSPNPTGPSSSG